MNKKTNIGQIEKLIKDAPLGIVNSIDLIGSGYASMAYKISSEKGKFVALIPKKDCIAFPNYAYYFSILKTLEEISYQYAPKAVYINANRTAIVMAQVPGDSLDWVNDAPENVQKQTVETLIDALLKLREASFERCSTIYKLLTGKKLETVTMQKNVGHYITEWFNVAMAGKPDSNLIDWIKPKVALCEEYARKSKPSQNIVLSHGDTSAGNVLATKDLHLNLIDWDTSCFLQYPDNWDDYGVAYLFNMIPMVENHRAFAISLVSDRCHIAPSDLESTINKSQELMKIGDTMWAIMMNSRVAAGEIDGDPNKFLKIASQRIDDYETMFDGNSFLTK